MAKRFKLNEEDCPTQLGYGAFGICYQISDTEAVKITTAYTEYVNATKLVGKQLKNVVDIYQAEKLSDGYNNNIYLIRMELLEEPDLDLRKMIGDGWVHEELKSKKKRFNNNVFKQAKSAYFQLLRRGIVHADIHAGNILKSKNDDNLYKVIDIMGP